MKRALRLLLLGCCLVSLTLLPQVAVPQEGRTDDNAAYAPEAPTETATVTSVSTTPIQGEHKVLFSACTPGKPSSPGLFIADADFSDPVRITNPSFDPNDVNQNRGCDSGAWSADGRWVAVVRNGVLHLLELKALAELPEQQPTPILRDGEPIQAWSPAWSPDNEWIAFHDDATGLMMVRPDGSGFRVLVPYTNTVTWIHEAEFSPDGKSIAIRMGGIYPHHLYLVTNLFDPGAPKVKQLTKGMYQESWPHFSPDGAKLMFTRGQEPKRNTQHGNVWVLDLRTGKETQITDQSYELAAQGLGWCPFDNKMYYLVFDDPEKGGVWIIRQAKDGATEEFYSPYLPVGRITWAYSAAWIDGVQALPGEAVTVKVGVQDADEVIEAISTIGVDGLTPLTTSLGKSTQQWTLHPPTLEGKLLTLQAAAVDPLSQYLTGPASLFQLTLGLPTTLSDTTLRLLTFPGLYLGNLSGPSYPRLTLAGSVQTIPFASLSLEVNRSNVPTEYGERAMQITVTAYDRQGEVMRNCFATVRLGILVNYTDPEADASYSDVMPLTPAKVMLSNGQWSGLVTLPTHPMAGSRIFAAWGDIAGYSPFLVPPER